ELPNVTTPVITTEGDDPSYPSGVSGLVVADLTSVNNPVGVGAAATFDNYRALTVEPPRLSIAFDPGQQSLRISWPGTSTGFTLESSTTLPAPSWTPTPADKIIGPFEEPLPADPDFKYFDFEMAGSKYFRLRR